MKTIILTLALFSLSIFSFAQRPPIPNLPAASLEDAGFNLDSINTLIPMMDNFQQLDFRGLVVIKDNQSIIEWYYNSAERTMINDIRSAGKSITSLLLGVAIKDGLVKSLDQDVYSFFSKEKYPSVNEDYKKITIRHLLDMSSGLDADSDDGKTPGHARHWVYNDEWVDYILNIPLVKKPGGQWVYADINVALIGAIIEETSGMSLNDFAKEKVFTPLGIKKYYWYTNDSNQTVAAGTLYLSTLDFAKLGVLVTNKGKWGDQQIVPSAYIEELIKRKVFDLSKYWSLWDSYGMLWYKNQETFNNRKIEYLWASGNGGNHLVVVPEENMVIALTSTAYGTGYGHRRARAILMKLLNALE
ncbi:MAG: serine hydrolase domain-containing protein [Saprospiraceae bacterium]